MVLSRLRGDRGHISRALSGLRRDLIACRLRADHLLRIAALLPACMVPEQAASQWQTSLGPRAAVLGAPVGSDLERYVRTLAIAGIVQPVAWAARDLSPEDLQSLLADSTQRHPWAVPLRKAIAHPLALGGSAAASYNTGFPWGANDGAQWQGRGATGSVGASASVRIGMLALTAAPLAFVAQNSAFPLMPTSGFDSVQTGIYAYDIDLPQRFGTGAYSRANGGESSVRLRWAGASIGVSTESEGWGVGESFPAILGPHAGGFPHLYVATQSRGIRIPGVGRVAARYLMGTLSQSAWSPVIGPDSFASIEFPGRRRVAVGAVASLMPAFAPGLELGVSRFYHSPWRNGGRRWDAWSKPFEGILKAGFGDRGQVSFDPTGDIDNQLASLHARWTLPTRGAELSFEYLREDHNYDGRDLAGEPEQNGATAAAARVLTHRASDELSTLTLEYFAGDVRPIAQQRTQGLLYFHGTLRQGHTEQGQLLGSPIGSGAVDGQRVAWERFRADGTLRFMLQRLRTRSKPSTDPERLLRQQPHYDGLAHDWVFDGSVQLTRFRGHATTALEIGVAHSAVFQFLDARTNVYVRASSSLF